MEKGIEFFMSKNYRASLYYDPDGYWVAEHPELPGCVADGETAQDALSSLDEARELWMESRLATGLEVPVPQDEPQFSGKFVLRLARSMHRELAKEAETEGVSLNTHISNILASRNAQKKEVPTQRDFHKVVSDILASGGYSGVEPLAPAMNDYSVILYDCNHPSQELLIPNQKSLNSPWVDRNVHQGLLLSRDMKITASPLQSTYGQSKLLIYANKKKKEALI